MVQRVLNIAFLFLLTIVKCSNLEARDETIFPNGTLVGTYQYEDARGNEVHVKYFADGNSYSINLKGQRMPQVAEETNKILTSTVVKPATSTDIDTFVPLKLDFPVIDNIYTIENSHNYTNDITNNNKQEPERNDNQDQPEDYVVDSSVFKTPTVKRYGKDKTQKKNIRRIRQALNILMRKIST